LPRLSAWPPDAGYSKQAFHQRLSKSIETFLADVAVALFSQMSASLRSEGCFESFGRVLLHDSTVQSLPGTWPPFSRAAPIRSANQSRAQNPVDL